MLLDVCDAHLVSVEDSRSQRCHDSCAVEYLGKVLHCARPAAGDDGHGNCGLHGGDELVVVSLALAVHIDAVEHNLPRAQRLRAARELYGVDWPRLSAALDCHRPPAPLLAVRARVSGVEAHDGVASSLRGGVGGWVGDIDALGVDGNDNCLGAVMTVVRDEALEGSRGEGELKDEGDGKGGGEGNLLGNLLETARARFYP